MDFVDFVGAAAGGTRPYPYQERLAAEGLPDVLCAPTGAGNTLAAVLPWLYRRTAHPDLGVRAATPRWLVVVLPQRALVEQTVRTVLGWRDNAAPGVGVHVLMGGQSAEEHEWKSAPERTRIFVGTQDMVLSRLLMRGFGGGRAAWPMSFGLLHAGVQFVFDEVQLMGPGLPTSLQLQGLRESLGVAVPCRSMWMSATIDAARLATVDFRRELRVVELTDADRMGGLTRRLAATRKVRRLDLGEPDARRYPRALAERVVGAHRAGTRTLVVCNTVERATAVYIALAGRGPEVVLLHSRFRPGDRRDRTAEALAAPGRRGTVVVATQVLEAGVDLTSDTLVTEVAPWTSIVQRAGRCNRDGLAVDARLCWVTPPAAKGAALPYAAEDLDATTAALTDLEGVAVTGAGLAAREVAQAEPVHPVLRRRDLLGLFDTAPDLSGNDIDVSPFVRDTADRTVSVAWRTAESMTTESMTAEPMIAESVSSAVGRDEVCPAPIAAVRSLVADRRRAWIFDQEDGRWRPARVEDVRPTAIVALDAAAGGYRPDIGFAAAEGTPVDPVDVPAALPDALPDAQDTDPQSVRTARWVSLGEHLADTRHEAVRLLAGLGATPGLSSAQRDAIVLAAALHDLGKAHPSFQDALTHANPDQPPPDSGAVWAKSPGRAPLRPAPPHFRHELAGALLLADRADLLTGADASNDDDAGEDDLVVYLVLAHHGKVRLTVRARPDEPPGVVLGVRAGSLTLPADLGGRRVGAHTLSLAATTLGPRSLTGRAVRLRDRTDLGPFRLAFAEALVRAADWRASAQPGGAGWPS